MGLSQEAVAKRLGLVKQSVSHWENDKNRPMSAELVKLEEILNTPVEYLLTGRQQDLPEEYSEQCPMRAATSYWHLLAEPSSRRRSKQKIVTPIRDADSDSIAFDAFDGSMEPKIPANAIVFIRMGLGPTARRILF